jgi:DNA polymerase-3 subunit delta
MKLKPDQLTNHLQRQGLQSIYLLFGDEALQMMECGDKLRTFARKQGFSERIVLSVETGFSWHELRDQANSLSLFATKRLIELRLTNKSPGDAGSSALIEYAEKPPRDTVLFITADKLDQAKQKSKWFTALEKTGVVIQVYPIEVAKLPEWIAQRMAQVGLQANPDAIQMIADRSEGHLLACAQEIEKLLLLYPKERIEIAHVLESVADSARFEIFDWVDAVLWGDIPRSVRQLQGLQRESCEPVLILWALDKDIRNLAQMAYAISSGQSLEQVFGQFRVWQNRRALINKALQRHKLLKWHAFLKHSARIDRIIKGAERGNVWDELRSLSLQVAGIR